MNLIERYREILNKADTDDPPMLPVIFNGRKGPRLVGYAADYGEVDACLAARRLSATYLSRAKIDGNAREFFVAYG